MIATGLVFVLGALVATLIALLFVPLLWRNAQRLARRDMAATMPATMNEIRAEVDRVRAEAAVAVRRSEMLAKKAQARAVRERAEVGRLTVSQADTLYLRDQHEAESNSLRGQLTTAQDRILRLEDDNSNLKGENESLRASLRSLEDAILSAAPSGETTVEHRSGPALEDDESAAQTRFDVASAAVNSILHEAAAGRPAGRTTDEEPERADMVQPSAPSPTRDEADAIAELRALADPARRPADPSEREQENALVRDRISSLAQRILQVTGNSEQAPHVGEGAGGRVSAADTQLAESGPAEAQMNPPSTAGRNAKRRRGGARSRRQSQH